MRLRMKSGEVLEIVLAEGFNILRGDPNWKRREKPCRIVCGSYESWQTIFALVGLLPAERIRSIQRLGVEHAHARELNSQSNATCATWWLALRLLLLVDGSNRNELFHPDWEHQRMVRKGG